VLSISLVVTGVALALTSVAYAAHASSGGDGLAAPARDSPRGSIRLTIQGLPGGRRAAVTLSGPGGFRRAVRATALISGLRAGRYRLGARSVGVGGALELPVGSVAFPAMAEQTVLVRAHTVSRARVVYGTIRSGHTHVLSARPAAISGSPSDPSSVTLSDAAGLGVGSILAAAPSSTLPAGLFDRVTAVARHGAQTQLALTPALLAEAFPALDVEATVPLPFGAAPASATTARAASLSGVDLAFGQDLIPGLLESSCGAPPTGWSFTPLGALVPDVTADLHRSIFGPVQGELSLTITGALGFYATIPSDAHCDLTLDGPKAATVIPIAGIPVPVEGSANLNISFALDGATSIYAGAEIVAQAGISLQGGSASPIFDITPSGSGSIASAGGTVSLGPQVQVGLGVADINAHVDDSLELQAKADSTGACELDVAFQAGVGLDFFSFHGAYNPIKPSTPIWHCPPSSTGPSGGAGNTGDVGDGGGGGGGPDPLAITTTSLANATESTPYTETLTATGGEQPYSWSVTSGSLPEGLTLDPGTGVISGTPTKTGESTFEVTVKDNAGATAAATLSLKVTGELSITTSILAEGSEGTPYTETLTATGGEQPYSWALTSGSLPEGLELSELTGEISGTPTKSGESAFEVTVLDHAGATAKRDYTLTVTGVGELPIVPSVLSEATEGTAYQECLEVEGEGDAAPEYDWAVTSGTLPPGLQLGSYSQFAEEEFFEQCATEIEGLPTGVSTSHFTLTAYDKATHQPVATESYTLTVNARDEVLTIRGPNEGAPSREAEFLGFWGVVGEYFYDFVSVEGGAGEYTWSLGSSALPCSGLSLVPDHEYGIAVVTAVEGYPTNAGPCELVIDVHDAYGDSGEVDIPFYVYSP